MATTVGNLKAYLTLDSSQYVTGLRSAEQAGNSFVSGVANIASGAAKAASVAFTGLATAAVGFGVASAKTALRAAEMDTVLTQLSKTTGVSKTVMDQQTLAIQKQGITLDAAQNLVAQFARSQLDMSKSSQLAATAQDLAVITMQDSSQTLNDLLYGLQTGNTQLDVFQKLNVQAGKAVSDYAKAQGKSTEELTAAERQQALLNEVLKQGELIHGTYAAAMEQPGKVLRSFPRLIQAVEVSLGTALLPAIGGVVINAYKMVDAFRLAVAEGGALHPVIDAIGKVVSSIGQPVADMFKRITGWIQQLKPETVQKFVDSLAQFAPALAGIAGLAGGLGLSTLGEFIPILGPLLAGINPLVLALVALGAATPAVREGFGQVLTALKPVGEELGRTFIGLLKELMPILDQVVKALMPVVVLIVRMAASLMQQLMPVLKPLIRAVMELVATLAKELQPVLFEILEAMEPMIPPFVDLVRIVVSLLVPAIKILTPILVFLIKLLAEQLVQSIQFVTPIIKELVKELDAIVPVVVGILNAVAGFVTQVVGWFTWLYDQLVGGSIIPDLVNGIVGWFTNLVTWVVGLITYLVGTVVAGWTKLWTDAVAWWGAIRDGVATVVGQLVLGVQFWLGFLAGWVSGHLTWLLNLFTSIYYSILGVAGTVWGQIYSTVTGWAQQLADGASAAITGMLDKIKGAFSAVKDFVRDRLVDIGTIWNAMVGQLAKIPGLDKEAPKWEINVKDLAKMASGGVVPVRAIGGGFMTSGPTAVVGEGRRSHPEYVIPTDPAYSSRAARLWLAAGQRLRMLQGGGKISSPWYDGAFAITQRFGNASTAYASGTHSGVDIGYPRGTNVRAGAAGQAQQFSNPGGFGTAIKFFPDSAPGVVIILGHLLNYAGSSGHKSVGDLIAHGDSTGFSTGDHLHFEVQVDGQPRDPMEWLQAGKGGGGDATALFNSIIEWARQRFAGLPPGFAGFATNLLTVAGPEMVKKIAHDVVDAVAGLLGWRGSEQFQDWARQAIRATGVSENWLRALDVAAKNESGYNPHAINLWDSNARAGTPSKGVMQVIDPTFAAYHVAGMDDIWNPVHNIAAAIRYIQARYGDIYALPGVKSVLAGGRWIGYDAGGVLKPGATLALNRTGQDEVVLTASTFQRLLRVLDRLDGALSAPRADGLTVHNHYGDGATGQEVVSDLLIALRTL